MLWILKDSTSDITEETTPMHAVIIFNLNHMFNTMNFNLFILIFKSHIISDKKFRQLEQKAGVYVLTRSCACLNYINTTN
jgi:hypothetical protein